jgi:bifunctional UDP-N-acetylglucosamine pyrophosphorylase/glucosamine-1-phosphate N-acetyltransferase
MNLIILAAGKGTRFYPKTKTIPKAMIRVRGRPLIEHVLEAFVGNVNKIIIVINDETGPVLENYLGEEYYGIPIVYTVKKTDVEKGTWPALIHGSKLLDTSNYFIVCNCDDIFNVKEITKLLKRKPVLTLGVSTAIMPKKYLGMNIKNGYITGTRSNMNTEEDTVSDLFCNGLHILSKDIFRCNPVEIAGGEYGLPQVIFKNLKHYPCKAAPLNFWISINKPEDIVNSETFLLAKN